MQQAIYNFESLTQFPLKDYFLEVETFFKISYPILVDYFKGAIQEVKQEHVRKLAELKIKADKLSEQFTNNKGKFQTVDYWELMDFCEDLRTQIETTINLPKYLRSSRTNFDYFSSFNFPYTIGMNQTLENISNDILQDASPDNDWANTALKNDLLETDYSIDGGKALTLFKEKFVGGFVQSVVDVMQGEKIYGLDIDKKITFVDDDLKVLSYKESVYQAVEILSQLKTGDVPEFPSFGLNASLYVGANMNGLSLPGIIRDLKASFASDDLFIDFVVTAISYLDGTVKIDFKVGTKYELLVESTVVV